MVAYAGVPLRAVDGEPIGTLCALDYEPRKWSKDDLAILTDLAAEVIAELQLLTATRLAARDRARLRALSALSSALAPAQDAGDVVDAVSRTVQGFTASAVWVSMVDEAGKTLRLAAASGAESAGRRAAAAGRGRPDRGARLPGRPAPARSPCCR